MISKNSIAGHDGRPWTGMDAGYGVVGVAIETQEAKLENDVSAIA